ncbi:MAG: hypothetical protein ATN35_11265 [Epulopiscium sp. Nele67-Bin004]|nr:MAG: hypothetical protein ATN35_11265 [Epulopiscium sp. Nele67-Bin004]
MKLTNQLFKNTAEWTQKGIAVPTFNIEETVQNTKANPTWIHFGAGNIFRGFIARVQDTLLEKGLVNSGIIAVDTFDFDVIDKIYKPYDNLVLLVKLKADGEMQKQVVAGISDSIKASKQFEEFSVLENAFKNTSLQMVSFTVTEKGYQLTNTSGKFLGVVEADINSGPQNPVHAMSIVCSLLLDRFNSGAHPISLVSMDNCSHNGDKLRNAVVTIAKEWQAKGHVSGEFVDYVSNEEIVAFPWSMIDKITPRPAQEVESELNNIGLEDISPVVTSKNTFIAPFVNAEIPEYLVIEDKFPNGRPQLEEGGVYITSRDTVNQVETMKVTTCLNPLHTALAVFGVTLGYDRIYKEMENPLLKTLVEKIGFEEGMKVVVDPKIINPEQFINEVIYERFSNPFIPDDPARIATDTSQKVGIRFGETIKSYIKSDELNVMDLTYIPLAIAGWFRYLLGVNDAGEQMTLSPDPLLEELTASLKDVKLGGTYSGQLRLILENEKIFGLNLVECGLVTRIEHLFEELIAGKGAVTKTLERYCGDMKSLSNFVKTKNFLVCIDSDGCAIDSMTIKHEQIFGPVVLDFFEVNSNKDTFLNRWNEINLNSTHRGVNRFVGLAMILGELGDNIDGLSDYINWTQSAKELSNDALKTMIENSEHDCFQKVLNWSLEVNKQIANLDDNSKLAFEGVEPKLAMISKFADVAIVSSANKAAVIEEWEHNHLLDKVNCVATQADGSKAFCIKVLLEQGYENKNVLMIGDAPGDLKAANCNHVNFYPIMPNNEVKSWQEIDSALVAFTNGNYDELQSELITNFTNALN